MKRIMSGLPLALCVLAATPAYAQNYWEDAAPPPPPAGASANQAIPARDAAGRYVTINQGLSSAETSWHVRAALNVAALSCRGSREAATVAAYNRLIKSQSVSLAAADAGTKARYRARHGAAWTTQHDKAMTRLYNYFAQPTVQREFCATAEGLLDEASQLSPGAYDAFAERALPQLEAPFLAFYRDYDAWRQANAAWRERRDGGGYSVASARRGPMP
jgi:hypothetical protein